MTSEPRGPEPRDGELSPIKRAFLAVEAMQAKLDAAERARREPIAIVGAGCRFPGGVRDLQTYWELLRNGVDAITPIPADRWDVGEYYAPDPEAPAKMYTRHGGFLDRIDRFDAAFFGISPREARSLDPQQRLLLEVTWEALEHAGEPADRLGGSRTGVFMGICTNDYEHLQVQANDPGGFDLYYGSGTGHSVAVGRLSYVLGLQGPCIAIDTACSSSLVALHLACQSLRAGESSMALVGGVTLILSPDNMLTWCKSRVLAVDGRCKTFDASGDGFGASEGCAVVVLKRLSDAVAAGNRILAVVRGTAVNQDGASTGLTAPNGPAQEALIRDALASGGVDPGDVDYVEAHGTGTVLGDPIEVRALGAVLARDRGADNPLVIGSVKTNFGHTVAAAGVAGVLKVVLALQHGEIPPHLGFHTPNPYIPWDELPLVVPTAPRPWPRRGPPRTAGVSSFGMGGTNAHAVIAEAPAAAPAPGAPRSVELLTLSAKTETALRQRAADLQHRLEAAEAPSLADVCFTANVGRAHLEHRLAIPSASIADLTRTLAGVAEGTATSRVLAGTVRPTEPPKIAFLFTGQGAQYAGMGRELYDVEPVFRAALDRCARELGDRPGPPLLEVLFGDAGAALEHTALAQPALFALEYALATMWRAWGVEPTFVVGHSLGEVAAACVAGLMSLEDALALVTARGRLMQELPEPGAMAAVEAEEPLVAAAVAAETAAGGLVAVGAVNAPRSIVVSGTETAVDRVTAALAARNVRIQRLRGRHAFHSPLMEPALAPLEDAAARVKYGTASIELISTLTGTPGAGAMARPRYWRDQARQPVQFARAMGTLWERGVRLCLEIGPQPVLIGLGQQVVADGAWIGSLRRGRPDWAQIVEALGRLYVAGARVDFAAVHAMTGATRVTLPTYPFERKRYWLSGAPRAATPASRTQAAHVDGSGHPLVGRRLSSPAIRDVVFETDVDAATFALEPRVDGRAVCPAASIVESVDAAVRHAFGDRPHRREGVVPGEPLTLGDDERRRVQIILTAPEAGVTRFSVVSLPSASPATQDAAWALHASGAIRLDTADDEASGRRSCLYEVQWQVRELVPAPGDSAASANGHSAATADLAPWLIVADRGGMGGRLAAALEHTGARCRLVSLPAGGDADAARPLLERHLGATDSWGGVVYMPGLDVAAGQDVSPSASQPLLCGGLLQLVQLLAAQRQIPRLWLVTRGAQAIDGDGGGVLSAAQAPLWGMATVVAIEQPALRCVRIDLEPSSADPLSELKALTDELRESGHEDRVAFRGGRRHVARLAPSATRRAGDAEPRASTPLSGAPARFRADATYLITGGLRGLGLMLAEHLVRCGARHLVLMGRTGPSAEAAPVIAGLEEAGAHVAIVPGDVTREGDVDHLFAKLAGMPPLRGIVHAAAVFHDGPLKRLSWDEFAGVLAPKVEGAWRLHRRVRDLPLDFFALFSSATSVLGAAGYAAYAAANAYLDTFAHDLRRRGVPATSIDWGVWSEIGFAAERNIGALRDLGMEPITPEAGCALFEEVLDLGRAQVVAFPVQWPLFLQWYGSGVLPAFLSSIPDARPSRAETAGAPSTAALTRELAEATPAQRQGRLTAYVQEQVGQVLGFDASDTIAPSRPLSDVGLDSLMAVELRNRLGKGLGLTAVLPATLVFDHPTIDAVVRFLLRTVFGEGSERGADHVVAEEDDPLDRIESLSDEDVDRLFADKLRDAR